MIRFVGYRQDSIARDLIYEGVDDTNWARAMRANSGSKDDDTPVFFLIDFKNRTATVSDNETGRIETVGIDPISLRADYLEVVIQEMETEVDALIDTHGVTDTD